MATRFFTQLAIHHQFPELSTEEVVWAAPWVHECDGLQLKRRFLIVRAASPAASG